MKKSMKAASYLDYIKGMPHNLQMGQGVLASIYARIFPINGGTFVEVGAYDGWSWSHTVCLAKLGWRGLYIEPIPAHAALCEETHKEHPDITTVCCACGATERKTNLYIKDATSSFVLNKAAAAFGVSKDIKMEVQIRVLNDILVEQVVDVIDVLVIDVEGFEIEVLNGFDIAKYKPRLAIIETHELSGAPFLNDEGVNETSVFCDAYFTKAGYVKIFADDGNTFYAKNVEGCAL